MENGDDKQRIEYAEICKTIKNNKNKRVHQEVQPRNDHEIKEPEERPEDAKAKQRQTDHTPRKEVCVFHDQYKIIQRIEESYTDLHDCGWSTIIHTDSNEVQQMEVDTILRDMKNLTAIGNDHI